MVRVIPWLSLVAVLALPQVAAAEGLCDGGSEPAKVAQPQAGPSAHLELLRCAEPDDEGPEEQAVPLPGDLGACVAAALTPAIPLCAAQMPSGERAVWRWVRSIQERGPPRALS